MKCHNPTPYCDGEPCIAIGRCVWENIEERKMKLMSVYHYDEEVRWKTLYNLLAERTDEQNISHQELPTWSQHKDFVERHPYAVWYFICHEEDYNLIYGSMYLTRNREIGIFIFAKYLHQGVGTLAMKALREIHEGPFLANIAPGNVASQKFFEKHGFVHIQNTYRLSDD